MGARTIGILGGMGPEATSDLFRKVIRNTEARKDQDHISVLIVSNPLIPDRTAHLLGKGPSPGPFILDGIRKLETMGCDLVAVPCNTSHFYLKDIRRVLGIPIIDMIAEVATCISEGFPDVRKVGLMASTGTVMSGLYENAFTKEGLETILPEKPHQERIMEAIYGTSGIKAGKRSEPREKLLDVLDHLESMGAEAVVLGCTELPLVLKQKHSRLPLIDSTDVLAKAAVRYAREVTVEV